MAPKDLGEPGRTPRSSLLSTFYYIVPVKRNAQKRTGSKFDLSIFGDSIKGVFVDMDDALLPLQASFAREFAQDWVDAWNSHDLERILTHYDDEVLLTSPVALKLVNGDGTVRGKAALREYFLRGIQAYRNLRFDLIDTLWGTETIVIYYFNNVRGSRTAEVMLLNPAGKICRVWANYDQ